MKLLVRGTNWIGDAVMSVPAIRQLRYAFPGAEITLATHDWAEGLFRDAEFIDEMIVIENQGHSPLAIRSQARQIGRGNFDAAVLFTNSFATALVARLAGVPRRIGYSGESRGFLLTDALPKPEWKNDRHEVHYYLQLAEHAAKLLGGTIGNSEPDISIAVSESRRTAAKRILSGHDIDVAKPVIALGAGSQNSRAKRWMPESFAAVADKLSSASGASIVLLGSEADAGVSKRVVASMKGPGTDLTGETSLSEAVALLAEADILIANDMGLGHVAAAVGTPVISIFGPTNPLTTAPWGGTVVREEVECSPCMLRDCPIDHRCMTRITPDRVISEALRTLGLN